MAFSARTKTTVSLVWKAARDNVRVAGYRLFRNGVSVATKATPGYTYKGLKCGTTYTFALVAYDAAGNTSLRAEATGSTSTAACTGGSPPPPPPTSPPVAGATIQPGQSWQSAYNAAAANSSLNVAAGNHGAQSLSGTKKVTFVGANGAVLRELDLNASNITLDNVDIDGNAAKVTILDNGGDHNLFKNLEIRDNTDVQMITNHGSSATYDNVFFHDAVMTTAGENAGVHMECMWSSGPHLTVRNSVFRDCAIMDIFPDPRQLVRTGQRLLRHAREQHLLAVRADQQRWRPLLQRPRSRQRRLDRSLPGPQQPVRPSLCPQRQPCRQLRLLRQHRPDRAVVGPEVLTLAPR